MAGAYTQAALQRGQGAAGPDNQDGRAQSAKAADPRSDLGHKVAARDGRKTSLWLASMLARKPRMLVTVALANKIARILGADGARRDLQNSGYGGIKLIAVARRSGRQESQTRGMAQGSEDGIGKASNYPKRL